MWFESKLNIKRSTKSYPFTKKDERTSEKNSENSFSSNDTYDNLVRKLSNQYHEVSRELNQILDDLNNRFSIPFAKIKKIVLAGIYELLEALYLHGWARILTTEHKFELLVRFITLLRMYHDIKFGKDEEKNMKEMIRALEFPELLEEKLIKLYVLRNRICHEFYELTPKEEIIIDPVYVQCFFFFLKKEFKPIFDSVQDIQGVNAEDYNNLRDEAQVLISNYIKEKFPDNQKCLEVIGFILDQVFQNL